MAAKLLKPPITATSSYHLFTSQSYTTTTTSIEIIKTPLWNRKHTRFASRIISITKAAEEKREFAGEDWEILQEVESNDRVLAQVKSELYDALQGINRGVFGVQSAKKSTIEELVKLLESHNPTPQPTSHLHKIAGKWKIIYSTITVLGGKRTKLGLRGLVTLGDFFQFINVDRGEATNVIKFNAKGFSLFNGQLQIDASFKIASKSRVDIHYNSSTITPDQLMNIFRNKYDLLLSIFNPNGWHEITCDRYVDDFLRIGRDNKGNIFILERPKEDKP